MVMKFLGNSYVRWATVLLWALVIFLLSHESAYGSKVRSGSIVEVLQLLGLTGSVDLLSTFIRKAAHVTIYAGLGGLLLWALNAHWKLSRNLALCAVVFSCVYAVSDEVHQAFNPGRSGEVRDVALDTFGASVGVTSTGLMIKRRQRQFTDTTKSAKVSE